MWWHRFFISAPESLHGSHLADLPRRNSKWRRMELQWACLIWPTPHALLWFLRTCGPCTQHDSWLLCFILLAWSARDESSFPQRLLWPLDPYSFSLPITAEGNSSPLLPAPTKTLESFFTSLLLSNPMSYWPVSPVRSISHRVIIQPPRTTWYKPSFLITRLTTSPISSATMAPFKFVAPMATKEMLLKHQSSHTQHLLVKPPQPAPPPKQTQRTFSGHSDSVCWVPPTLLRLPLPSLFPHSFHSSHACLLLLDLPGCLSLRTAIGSTSLPDIPMIHILTSSRILLQSQLLSDNFPCNLI